MNILYSLKKIDYRHYVCIAITLGFLCLSVFVFNLSFVRFIEGILDLATSLIYYFCFLIDIESPIVPTVNNMPYYPEWIPVTAVTPFFESWAKFKSCWGIYWQQWANWDNFMSYLYAVCNVLTAVCKFILLFMPVFVLLLVIPSLNNTVNNNYNKDSLPLKTFKRIARVTYHPVKCWCLSFVDFIKENGVWWKIWICIWLFNLNVVTIVVEFLAFYFYFVASFDLANIYTQVYKLVSDLWLPLMSIPLPILISVGVWFLDWLSIHWGYKSLEYKERCNRAFINMLGVVSICDGAMGVGKTTQITDMALSEEVQLLDDALEVILETDMHFPNFPWIVFENVLKRAVSQHKIYDLWSCRKFVRKKYARFNKAQAKGKKPNLYDYDYELYGMDYNDNLKVISIWEALEDYACAYFVYTIQSSFIISNYSIRSDVLMKDLGNFPLRDTSFFKRDSRLLDSYSRHSHILDNDMLRLGKIMLKDNPNRFAFGFGVYVYTEIDKDRKNQLEMRKRSVRSDSENCNQENDLFNALWKMSRHGCVIANRPFVRLFADLQRSSSLGSDLVEIGQVLHVKKYGNKSPVLPFFSPFCWVSSLRDILKPHFEETYLNHRFNRGDNTLFIHIFKNLYAKLNNFCERRSNLFNCQKIKIGIESGLRDGNVNWYNYYRMDKKIYSGRFRTDCLSSVFASRAEYNKIGLDDLKTYADIFTKWDEVGLQNSHFYNEINQLNSI